MGSVPVFQRKSKNIERTEYRAQQRQQMSAAATLADKFPSVHSLSMELGQYDGNGMTRISQMKQTVNLERASSVMRIDCGNTDCVRGDFDLTGDLTRAVRGRRSSLSGELCCQGWRNKEVINKVRCGRVLRYKLTLEYS